MPEGRQVDARFTLAFGRWPGRTLPRVQLARIGAVDNYLSAAAAAEGDPGRQYSRPPIARRLAIFAIAAPAVVAVTLTRSNHGRPEMNDKEEDNEAFLRRFCICEEEWLARTGEMRTDLYGPRWFCSENIVPIKQARTRRRARGENFVRIDRPRLHGAAAS